MTEERLRKRERDRLRKGKETNEERYARIVDLCPHLSLITFRKACDRNRFAGLRKG